MGNHIRELRRAKGWSVRELGERMGVHFTTVARLERSERSLTYEWAARFAEAFGASINEVSDKVAGSDLSLMSTPVMPAIKQSDAQEWEDAVQKTKSFIRMSAAEPRAFAIEVEDRDLVDRPTGNLIAAPGSHVIIDPDDLDLCDEHYFATTLANGQVAFTRFLVNPARLEICSRDADQPDVMIGRDSFALIGRVIGVYVSFL